MTTKNHEVIKLTEDLVKIDSYTLEGKWEIMTYMKEKIEKETGATTRIYEVEGSGPYLVAYYQATKGPRLLFHGHLDTVSHEGMDAPLNPKILEGELYGRGGLDMKAGCACSYYAFKEACHGKARGSYYLMYSSDEETHASQTKDAIKRGYLPQADLAIINEPTNMEVKIAQKGDLWVEVLVKGKASHSSRPELGINAIDQAYQFIKAYKEFMESHYLEEDGELGRLCYNLGMIEGGVEPNSVPARCRMVYDIRYLPSHKGDKIVEDMAKIAEILMKENPNFSAQVTELIDCLPMTIPKDHPQVVSFKNLVQEFTGKIPKVGGFPGWGEGGLLFGNKTPSFYFGPGDGALAHSLEERVPLKDIIAVYDIMKAFVNMW